MRTKPIVIGSVILGVSIATIVSIKVYRGKLAGKITDAILAKAAQVGGNVVKGTTTSTLLSSQAITDIVDKIHSAIGFVSFTTDDLAILAQIKRANTQAQWGQIMTSYNNRFNTVLMDKLRSLMSDTHFGELQSFISSLPTDKS